MAHVFVYLIFGLCLVAGAALFSIDMQAIAAAVTLTTTAETLVATGMALSLPSQSGKAAIRCYANVTAGTGTTLITLNVYRGTSVSGSPAFTAARTIPAAASSPQFDINAAFSDALNNATQAQYCFSITQTGASGNGSVTAASIQTELLSG